MKLTSALLSSAAFLSLVSCTEASLKSAETEELNLKALSKSESSFLAGAKQDNLPRIIFAGVLNWDEVAVRFENPYIFITNFELNSESFENVDSRIKFGLKLFDSEVELLEHWYLDATEIDTMILKWKQTFEAKTRTPLQFCVSDIKTGTSLTATLAKHGIKCEQATRWSWKTEKKPEFHHLYVNTNFFASLDKYSRYCEDKTRESDSSIVSTSSSSSYDDQEGRHHKTRPKPKQTGGSIFSLFGGKSEEAPRKRNGWKIKGVILSSSD